MKGKQTQIYWCAKCDTIVTAQSTYNAMLRFRSISCLSVSTVWHMVYGHLPLFALAAWKRARPKHSVLVVLIIVNELQAIQQWKKCLLCCGIRCEHNTRVLVNDIYRNPLLSVLCALRMPMWKRFDVFDVEIYWDPKTMPQKINFEFKNLRWQLISLSPMRIDHHHWMSKILVLVKICILRYVHVHKHDGFQLRKMKHWFQSTTLKHGKTLKCDTINVWQSSGSSSECFARNEIHFIRMKYTHIFLMRSTYLTVSNERRDHLTKTYSSTSTTYEYANACIQRIRISFWKHSSVSHPFVYNV